MAFPLAPLITGGLSLIGGLLGNKQQANSAQQQQASQAAHDREMAAINFKNNKELQRLNIDWQQRQHENSHQWETNDLRAAGLNPILSANSGGQIASAAQSSGVSSGPMAKAELRDPITPAVSSALGAMSVETQQDAQKSQADLNAANANKANAEARDLTDKHNADFWRNLSSSHEATAAERNANEKVAMERINVLKAEADSVRQQITESQSRVDSLREALNTAKSEQARNYAQSALSSAEAKLADARSRTEDILREARLAAEWAGTHGPLGKEVSGLISSVSSWAASNGPDSYPGPKPTRIYNLDPKNRR